MPRIPDEAVSASAIATISTSPAHGSLRAPPSTAELLERFLAEQSPLTQKGYRQDLARFAAFLRVGLDQLAGTFFRLSGAEANYAVSEFKIWMRDHGGRAGKPASSATVNRRLAAIKSFTKMGRLVGAISWHVEVPNMQAEAQRDMRGPTLEEVQRLIAEAQKKPRDYAIVLLLFVRGLRSVEVRELRVEDVDLERGAVNVRGKGHRERKWETIPLLVTKALAIWIRVRESKSMLLFPAHDGGIMRQGVFWRILSKLAERAGLHAWPHGLRHSAITLGLDLTDGDIRSVRAFSRHAKPEMVMRYDDARKDLGGAVAEKLANLVIDQKQKPKPTSAPSSGEKTES